MRERAGEAKEKLRVEYKQPVTSFIRVTAEISSTSPNRGHHDDVHVRHTPSVTFIPVGTDLLERPLTARLSMEGHRRESAEIYRNVETVFPPKNLRHWLYWLHTIKLGRWGNDHSDNCGLQISSASLIRHGITPRLRTAQVESATKIIYYNQSLVRSHASEEDHRT